MRKIMPSPHRGTGQDLPRDYAWVHVRQGPNVPAIASIGLGLGHMAGLLLMTMMTDTGISHWLISSPFTNDLSH